MNPCVATVGTFDGFHIGHRAIVDKVKDIAREKGIMSRAITFMNHPLTVIAPERAPKWAIDRSQSCNFLRFNLDRVSEMNFTSELAAMTARDFMRLLRERFNVDTLVMGYDNTFGSDRLATHEDYVSAGRDAGIEVVFVDAVNTSDGRPVSSSRLRKAIAAWDYNEITSLLEMSILYPATVVKGRQMGRRIGFPTLNLEMRENIVEIPDGVYLAFLHLNHEDDGMPGVLSVGTNPTVGGTIKTYELHIFDRKLRNMYDEEVYVLICERFRDIKKFDSLNDLKNAIRDDIKTAKRILREDDHSEFQ